MNRRCGTPLTRIDGFVIGIAGSLFHLTIVAMCPPKTTLPIDSLFDVEFADSLAQLETFNKHHYRPNTYLHKWWGRRCGSTFRLILKGLVKDPAFQSYYAPGGLAGMVILDPMMGGGTTLHEAIRLGASVIGVDVDPIPVLQARATMTDRPLPVLRTVFNEFYEGLTASIGRYFLTHCPACDEQVPLWYSLYGLRRRCACGDVLVVDSLVIRHEPDGTSLLWCSHCGEMGDGHPHQCEAREVRIIEKDQDFCDQCGERYRDDITRPFFSRYEMLAVAGHCPSHGLFHKSPDWRDADLLHQANECREALELRVEDFCIIPGDKSVQLLNRKIENYLDLFSSRQLIFLNEAVRFIPNDDPVVGLNLALLVSTSLEFNSMLCGFKGVKKRRAGAVRHTFSHHGYSFPYTALENNPVYPRRASGTLQKLFHSRIVRGYKWAQEPLERVVDDAQARFISISGERDKGTEVDSSRDLGKRSRQFLLVQGSSVNLPVDTSSIDAVITDPPYYDSIQYGDLSAFFRVWLRRLLPDAANWDYDQRTAAVNSERNGMNHHYVDLMTGILQECRRVLKPDGGRLIFTFHHWQPRAWAALSVALSEAGFVLINRYVVHAEHPMSVHISKMRALTHDAILVFAAREKDHVPHWKPVAASEDLDSFRFTHRCATLLGWILDQPHLSVGHIEKLWLEALGENGSTKNGKAPSGPR